MIKFCKKCQEENAENCPSGYYFGWKDSVTQCPNCGGNMIDIDFPAKDLAIIEEISEDTYFIEAMIKLYQEDIIEYETKMSQFRSQVQQQESNKKRQFEQSKVHCPYCNSTNVKKITGTERVASVAMWGLLSKKINKSFKCNNCGGTF